MRLKISTNSCLDRFSIWKWRRNIDISSSSSSSSTATITTTTTTITTTTTTTTMYLSNLVYALIVDQRPFLLKWINFNPNID